tara:strand:- start:814 stop:1443 length:630 start_codon:yes stop_codon:yes gene_type:complete
MAWKIWICVPVLYALFAAWYFNWQGPISIEEVNRLMLDFDKLEGSEHTDAATFRKFLEEDDGGEFVMLNLVQLHTGEVAHPLTGEAMSASDLVGEYFGPFAVSLFKRGGHPVFQARTIGGNIDSWNADHNLGFGATAMMRYKSRRDITELILDPAFADAHIYKLASIDRTISYPTRIMMSTALQPPSAVLVVLILLASLVQNLSFLIRS